jgi:hypothetical protein
VEEVVALPLFTLHIAQDKPRAVSDERLAKTPNFAEQTKQQPLLKLFWGREKLTLEKRVKSKFHYLGRPIGIM